MSKINLNSDLLAGEAEAYGLLNEVLCNVDDLIKFYKSLNSFEGDENADRLEPIRNGIDDMIMDMEREAEQTFFQRRVACWR